MNNASQAVPQPPQPPKFERKLHFYPFQLIGIPILFVIPILALLGVFGETSTTIQQAENGLELEVHYSNRVLFQGLDGTEIHVENTSNQTISNLTIQIEKSFLDNYSDLSFTPEVDEITEQAYVIELLDVQPGETRIVAYDSRGKIVGSHQGRITASTATSSVAVSLDVWIIP